MLIMPFLLCYLLSIFQILMSVLCRLGVMCAPTAAPTPQEVSTARAPPQATHWDPMDTCAKV